MRRALIVWLPIAWLAGVATPGAAEIYRWTDAQGGHHFAMDLSKVPPQYRAAAKASAGSVGKKANINVIPPAARASDQAGRGRSLPPSRSRPSLGSSSPVAQDQAERIGGRDEAWWRSRTKRYTDEIASLESQLEACEDVKAPRRYNARTGKRMKRQHYDRQMDAADRCSTSRSTLSVKQRQLSNFRENARKKGVPPGWLRTY